MNTKQLRWKILDLAIRGKLVPQDPNEKNCELRITNEDAPFKIPESWVWVKICDVCEKQETKHPTGDIFRYIDINSIDNRRHCVSEPKIMPTGQAPSRAAKGVCFGDTVFSMVRPYLENIAFITKDLDDCIASTGFYVCRPYKKLVSPRYLYFYLTSNHAINGINSYMRGDNSPAIRKDEMDNFLMPIPAISEQKRIVAAIESTFAVIDEIEQNKADLQTAVAVAKSKILALAISGKLVPQDPADEPASVLLDRIQTERESLTKAGKIKRGKNDNMIFCDDDKSHYGNIPNKWALTRIRDAFIINPRNIVEDSVVVSFVPMTLIGDGFFNRFTFQERLWGDVKSGFTHFQNEDVGLAKITPCLENRKSVIFRGLVNGVGAGTTELHIFRPISAGAILSDYLLWFIKSERFINGCIGAFSGAVGQRRVGKDYVADTIIPIPPLAEQHRIVAAIERAFEQLGTITKNLGNNDNSFSNGNMQNQLQQKKHFVNNEIAT